MHPGGGTTRRLCHALAMTLLLLGCGRTTHSEATMDHPQHSPEALSLDRITPREPGATLELLSDAIDTAGAIDLRHSAYGENLSPPLRWTPVAGAGAYAIILEDPDAPMEKPFVHWMIWNIPGSGDYLSEGVPNNDHLITPQGAGTPGGGRADPRGSACDEKYTVCGCGGLAAHLLSAPLLRCGPADQYLKTVLRGAAALFAGPAFLRLSR